MNQYKKIISESQ